MIVEDLYALIAGEESPDGKAPISLIMEDVYALIVDEGTFIKEEGSQAYALISDEASLVYDKIAEETSRFLLFFKFLGEIHSLLHLNAIMDTLKSETKPEPAAPEVAMHPWFFLERPGEIFVKEGCAVITPSENEGEEAQVQEEVRASDAPDEVVNTRNIKDDAIQDEAGQAKEVTEKEAVDQEKAQKQDLVEKFRAGEVEEEARDRDAPDEVVKTRNVKVDVIQDDAVRANEVTENEAVEEEKKDLIEKFRGGEAQNHANVEVGDFF